MRAKSRDTSRRGLGARATARALLVAALAGCGGGGGSSAPEPAAAPTPEPARAWLAFERDSEDFGRLYPNTVRRTVFEMEAAGEDDLVISAVARSCNCSEAELLVLDPDAPGGRRPVELGAPHPPGTRFELHASLNTKGKRGDQHQFLTITPGGQEALFLFHLYAHVEPFLIVAPELVDLGTLSPFEEARGAAELRSQHGEPFGVDVRRDVLPEGVEVDLAPVEPDPGGRAARWTAEVRVLPGRPSGPLKTKLILLTDVHNPEAEPDADGELPIYVGELWVRGEVGAVAAALPERLSFGRIGDEPVVRAFGVRQADPEFALASIEVALLGDSAASAPFAFADRCEVRAEEVVPGREWRIELEIAPLPVAGPFAGTAVVRIGHPQQELVTVPFRGVASGSE
jgi:hypothetical protein